MIIAMKCMKGLGGLKQGPIAHDFLRGPVVLIP